MPRIKGLFIVFWQFLIALQKIKEFRIGILTFFQKKKEKIEKIKTLLHSEKKTGQKNYRKATNYLNFQGEKFCFKLF